MGRREQIDLAPYRQPAAKAYADDVVDPESKGVMTPDYVNGLLQAAYLAGVTSIAPEGATARWDHTIHVGGGTDYTDGSFRQRSRAVNKAMEINATRDRWARISGGRRTPADARPLRRVIIEGGWEEI